MTVETLALIWAFLSAATVMDVNPMVIQLVDGLDFPVLPRNPSASDPLNAWYIKVTQFSPPSLPSSTHGSHFSALACLYPQTTSSLL